jgi:hypothetical protein
MDVRARRSPASILVLALVLGGPARGAADGSPALSPLSGGPPPNSEIAGRVADAAGTPLEGVAVSVRGPTLPGPRFAITTSAGRYRVAQLPAGVYSVVFALSGFEAEEQPDVGLGEGASAEVNARMAEWSAEPVYPWLDRNAAAAVITRDGGQPFAGRARFDYTDWHLQSDNLTPELKAQGAGFGNPVRRAAEAALDMGGPILRDRAWWWGSAARSVVDRGVIGFYTAACLAPDGTPAAGAAHRSECMNADVASLDTADLKLQLRWTPAHRTTLLWGIADRHRPSRGASAFDRPEHTNRQEDISFTQPVQVQHQWTVSDRLVLDGGFAFSDGRFVLDFHDPGLADVQGAYDRYTLVNSRSGVRTEYRRPKTEVEVGGLFVSSGVLGGDHSTSFGIAFLDAPRRQWDETGGGAVAVFDSRLGTPVPYQAQIVRDGIVNLGARRYSAFLEESYRRGRVSIDAGIRFDRQDDEALETTIPANRVLPELLPAVYFSGADSGVVYNDVAPRFGLAWDVTGGARTVLKATAARHWGVGNTSSAPLQPTGQTRLVYWWNDANQDGFVQSGELDLWRGPAATPSPNYDPANPASVRSPATVDPRLENDVTDELTVGFERQLARHLTVRATYVGRKTRQVQSTFPINADGSLVDSSTYEPVRWAASNCPAGARCPEVTYYRRDEALPAGTVLRNDGEYAWRHGVNLDLHKRLAGGWMLDISLAWNTAAWYFPRPTFDYTDPTNIAQRNGTEYSVPRSHWVVEASGSARLPWGFTTASAFSIRQGLPYARGVTTPNRGVLGSTVVDIGRYGSERYPAVSRLDWQIDRTFRAGRLKVVPVLNVFNVLNSNAVLARNRVQNTSSANDVTRIVAPRLVHIGASVTF